MRPGRGSARHLQHTFICCVGVPIRLSVLVTCSVGGVCDNASLTAEYTYRVRGRIQWVFAPLPGATLTIQLERCHLSPNYAMEINL